GAERLLEPYRSWLEAHGHANGKAAAAARPPIAQAEETVPAATAAAPAAVALAQPPVARPVPAAGPRPLTAVPIAAPAATTAKPGRATAEGRLSRRYAAGLVLGAGAVLILEVAIWLMWQLF